MDGWRDEWRVGGWMKIIMKKIIFFMKIKVQGLSAP